MAEFIKTINGEVITTVVHTGDIKTFDGQIFTVFGIPDKIVAVAEEEAEGYGHTVMGVAAGSISTVMGIATANVSKVNGV